MGMPIDFSGVSNSGEQSGEIPAESPPSGAGAGSPGEAGTFDWEGFAGKAGLSREHDPDTVREALDFHKNSNGKRVFSDEDLEGEFRSRQKAWFEKPENVERIEGYYRNLFKSMGLLREQQAAAEEREADGRGSSVPPQFQEQFGRMLQQMQGMAQRIEELQGHETKRQSERQGQDWLKQFNATLTDSIERHGNGIVNPTRLAQEVKKAYAAREFTDDSPAGVRNAVRTMTANLQGLRDEWFKGAGVDQMVRANELPFSKDTKLSDVVMDDDKLDRALDIVINRGIED